MRKITGRKLGKMSINAYKQQQQRDQKPTTRRAYMCVCVFSGQWVKTTKKLAGLFLATPNQAKERE